MVKSEIRNEQGVYTEEAQNFHYELIQLLKPLLNKHNDKLSNDSMVAIGVTTLHFEIASMNIRQGLLEEQIINNDMNTHLTIDNISTSLMKCKTLSENEFKFDVDIELIKGKSMVANTVGTLWLYMGDDHRKEIPQQIIVKRLGYYELAFLPISCKKAIKLNEE